MKADIITIGQVLLFLLLVLRDNILISATYRDRSNGRHKITYLMDRRGPVDRITGPTSGVPPSGPGSYPSFVGLVGTSESSSGLRSTRYCGGVAINRELVLTANQCFHESMKIRAAQSIYHPKFWDLKKVQSFPVELGCKPEILTNHSLANDFQILRVTRPSPEFEFRYSPLAAKPTSKNKWFQIVGFGSKGKHQQWVTIRALTADRIECSEDHRGNLCLRSNGATCTDDIGSPAYWTDSLGRQIVVGIASTVAKDCEDGESRISLFVDVHSWVDEIERLGWECGGSDKK